MPTRPLSRADIATVNPMPSSPSRFAAGTRTPSSTSSAVHEPWRPIFSSGFPALRPGHPPSTRKALTPLVPSPVRAMTMYRSASPALVMNALEPSSTYVSASRTARVCNATASLPPAGSVSANAASNSPEASSRKIPRLLVIIAKNEQRLGADREVHVEDHGAARVGSGNRFDEVDEIAMCAAGAPEADRREDSRETGFARSLDELLRVWTFTPGHGRCDRSDDVLDESGYAPGERCVLDVSRHERGWPRPARCRCRSPQPRIHRPGGEARRAASSGSVRRLPRWGARWRSRRR